MIETQVKKQVIPGVFDYVFKELVTDKSCRKWLAAIISDVTGLDYEALVKNIIIKDARLEVNNKNEKKNVSDILIEVDKNYINLEMNNNYYEGLIMRNNAYHASILKSVYKTNTDYLDIEKIIQINFNNYNKNNSKKIINKFMIIDVETKEIENEMYEKYYINLPKVKEICYNKDNNKLTRIEKNLILLVETNLERLKDISMGEESMEKVVEKLEKLSEDDFIIGMWDYEEDRKKIERSKIKNAERIGYTDGMEKGIKKGIERGKKEEKINTILNLLKEGIDIEVVSRCTNLSIEEINNLNNKD